MYWFINTVLGLYIVNDYNDYLEQQYPDLQINITVFATKWFNSIVLTWALLALFAFGSLMPCFGDFDTLKQLVIGLFVPIYFTCVMI